MNSKNISIRLSLEGGDKVKKDLIQTGTLGQKALNGIKDATTPVSKSLQGLNVVTGQCKSGAETLAGSAGNLGSSLSKLGPIGFGAAAAIGGVTMAIKKGLHEYQEAEHAFNNLKAALVATDHASGVTASQIEKLSKTLEKTTLFKEEEIQIASSKLASYGNITGEVFKRTLALSTDLATRLGTDVGSATEQLAKALERPENGLGKLAKKMSDLSLTQKDSIKAFLEQGDVMSAQMVIIDHVKSKIGGLAESQMHGLTGQTNRLGKAWDNLFESIGRVISQTGAFKSASGGLSKMLESMRKSIDPTLEERKGQLEKSIKNLEKDNFLNRGYENQQDLKKKREELKKVNAELAKEEEENQKAKESAAKAALEKKNQALLEIQRRYKKQHDDLVLNPREKILRDHQINKKEILAKSKGADPEKRDSALRALDENTNARLEEFRKKAIDEINSSSGGTSNSYEASKQALDEWKANLIQNLGGATEENQKYLAQVEEIYAVKLKDVYNNATLDSWADGAQRALMRYSDSAMNAAANAEKLFGTVAKKVEDTLTDVVTSGEFSFNKLRDVAKSVLDDIVRMFIQQSITGPLFSMLGGFMGGGGFFGLFHQGGVVGVTPTPMKLVNPAVFENAPRLHNGLAPDEFPAILQKGETVIPKNKSHHHKDNFNIVFNVQTPNAQSFMESRGQIMASLASEMDRYKRRNS